MLFDTEDYAYLGIIGQGKLVPERTIKNLDPGDFLGIAISTEYSVNFSINQMFRASIQVLSLEKRPAAFQKYFTYLEKRRNFKIQLNGLFNIFSSLKVKPIEGGITFNDGDLITTVSAEEAPEGSPIFIAGADRGLLYSWMSQDDPAYGYNGDNLAVINGEVSPSRAVIAGEGQWSFSYKAWNEVDYNNYLTSFEELVSAQKELLIECEGGVANFTPVV